MEQDIFRGVGVEITLANPGDFLRIKETLTRIGISAKTDKRLYQSCHILHKQGRYVILHFKELFALDGKPTNITEEDLGRRNTIARLLDEWNLCKVLEPESIEEPSTPISQIKIISYSEKAEWDLISKYSIGIKHNK